MAIEWLTLILLATLTLAEIHIDFKLKENNEYNVTSSGKSSGVVDNSIRDLFSITEDGLRTGVEALAGSRPDRVFLNDELAGSTPFLENGWRETSAETVLLSYDVPEINRRKDVIFVEHYDRPSHISFGFILPVHHEVSHAFGHSSANNKILNYRWSVDNRRPFMYSNPWGNAHREVMISNTTVETNTFEIQPSSNLTYEVNRDVVTVATGFVYSTHLSGKVVGFWSRGFNGRQFWAYDVEPVLRFGGMPLQAFTSERVSVLYNLGYELRFRHTEEEDLNPPFD